MEKKKKKIFVLGIVRHIIQLAAFLLFPGLFILTFAALKDIYTALLNGSFDALVLAPQIILAISMLAITALMGRFFCGFLCSFGAMGDLLWWLGKKLKLHRRKVSEHADGLLKMTKYFILAAIVVLTWTFGLPFLTGDSDPWTIFGMYASIQGWPAVTHFLSIGGLLLVLIIVGSLFIERLFCRYLCPLGAVFTILSRFRLFRIQKPTDHCRSCRACTSRCSIGISLYRDDVVRSGECIDCFECVRVCPRSNVEANPSPAMATALTVTLLTGLYYVGNLSAKADTGSSLAANNPETISLSNHAVTQKGDYTDGIYTGTAAGYRGDTQVQVTVKNGYLSDIQVLSTGDDLEFFNRAKGSILSDIVTTQSANVSTVAGATFSSEGIIHAVADALSGAGGSTQIVADSTTTDVQTATDSPTANTTSPSTTSTVTITPTKTPSSSTGQYNDGVYSGSGTGFRGTTRVSVTVSGGKISDITVVSYQDDAPYFRRAKNQILSDILSAQSVNVNTVSGATYSSNGILEAVADALNINFTNTNGSGSHGGHFR